MKTSKRALRILLLVVLLMSLCAVTVQAAVETTAMYRLYNPNTGEHFYTGSVEERDNLKQAGWKYEGVAWDAPTRKGKPVYRLYNPNSGDHHYTMSVEERDMLVELGWIYEGVCWNSASSSEIPLFRLWNPNADLGSHHYTNSVEERDHLVSVGWIYEGIGWFGASGHDYISERFDGDCTTDAYTEYICKDCGYTFKTDIVPAPGHNWVEATCTEAKRCTACDLTEGDKLGHTVKIGTCDRCGEQITDAEKKAAIEEENKRHEKAVAMIEGTYDAEIEINEATIDSLKDQYGIGYVYSADYYYNKQSDIQSDIYNLMMKKAYSTSPLEQARLQRQIDSLQVELTKVNICLNIIDLEERNESLESQREIALAQEERNHQKKLEEIEEMYR